jgi:hypothetical protein
LGTLKKRTLAAIERRFPEMKRIVQREFTESESFASPLGQHWRGNDPWGLHVDRLCL